MVKHTQTIRWQKPTNCVIVFDHSVGLVLKGLKLNPPQTVLVLFFNLFCTSLIDVLILQMSID